MLEGWSDILECEVCREEHTVGNATWVFFWIGVGVRGVCEEHVADVRTLWGRQGKQVYPIPDSLKEIKQLAEVMEVMET
jgi:hypothetical protein